MFWKILDSQTNFEVGSRDAFMIPPSGHKAAGKTRCGGD